MKYKDNIGKILAIGRGAAIVAGVGCGVAQVIEAIAKVAEKDSKTNRKFAINLGYTALLTTVAAGLLIWIKDKNAASRYKKERQAEGELYTVQKQADERDIIAKAKVGVHDAGGDKAIPATMTTSDENLSMTHEQSGVTWYESFKLRYSMPSLPPFLGRIMEGVPAGYEEAMLLHLCSMLGSMCFSRVRAQYNDNAVHAPNLQVVVEGNWGAGKEKFNQLYKELFARIIQRSQEKIGLLGNKQDNLIIQTTGIGTSMSKYVDILAHNRGCHMYIFNSEIEALSNDLKKENGLNFDFLRKAFENGDVCRNNLAKEGENGIFPVFLNYTFTGTPRDIDKAFKKQLEGGTLSRIAWTFIPEAERCPYTLQFPKEKDMEAIRNQIDEWTERYCFQHSSENGDEVADEFHIDLDYVCAALKEWAERQYDQSRAEGNPARADVRLRVAAIAFHCAMVFHMLFDEPKSVQKCAQIVNLTLFVADYCMERFLHKFGESQNEQRKYNKNAELVKNNSLAAAVEAPKSNKKLVTDIAELAELHSRKDERGQPLNGWGTLAKLSGMPKSTVRRKVQDYEKEHS